MNINSTMTIQAVMAAAPATTQPYFLSEWVDLTAGAAGLLDRTPGQLNGVTPVDVVAAPGGSTTRQLLALTICNLDTVAATITIRTSVGGSYYPHHRVTIQAGDSLYWSPKDGLSVNDAFGNVRTIATPGGAGVGTGDNISVHGHAGGGGWEIWHVPMHAANTAFSTAAITANRLYAEMFVAPRRGGRLDRIAVNVTTGAAGAMRLGIYAASSESNIYAGALVLDAGTVDVTGTGVKAITISQALVGGQTYWAAGVSNVAPTIRGLAIAGCSGALGISSALGTAPNTGMYAAFSYAALPNPYPAGATILTAAPIPAFALRFDQ